LELWWWWWWLVFLLGVKKFADQRREEEEGQHPIGNLEAATLVLNCFGRERDIEREGSKDGAADVRVVQRPKSSSYQTTQPATGLFFCPMKEKKAKDQSVAGGSVTELSSVFGLAALSAVLLCSV
jgi:hypothetical protein